MLKLKFQYFGHLMRTADLLENTLKLGKIEGGTLGMGPDTGVPLAFTVESASS